MNILKFIVLILLTLTTHHSFAQSDTLTCFPKSKFSSGPGQKSFLQKLTLPTGQTVYKYKLSPGQCFHCAKGIEYYDSTCKRIAAFTMAGRMVNQPHIFVAEGYNGKDFSEYGSYQSMISSSNFAPPIPPCIRAAINKPDSLKNAGISSVQQLQINNRVLYYFERKPAPTPGKCNDCAVVIVYIDGACREAVKYTVGGIAGITGTNGFTATHFREKKIVKKLWVAPAE